MINFFKKSFSKKEYCSNHICILDPSISTTNIGDEIIVDACKEILTEIFPNQQLISIPTQDVIGKLSKKILKSSKANIIMGTNILSSRLLNYRQLRWNIKDLFGEYELITMGVGWWQYEDNIDFISQYIYKRLLNEKSLLSTRDNYTKKKLTDIGFANIVNTSCPTMWKIPINKNIKEKDYFEKCLLTLTDYNRDPINDSLILKKAFNLAKEVTFFPQAPTDLSYLRYLIKFNSLSIPKILKPSKEVLKNFYKKGQCCFLGTRLHSGLLAAKFMIPCLIIAIDNRVKEIFDDCELDYLIRDHENFCLNLDYKYPRILNPKLNFDLIRSWKSSLKGYVENDIKNKKI